MEGTREWSDHLPGVLDPKMWLEGATYLATDGSGSSVPIYFTVHILPTIWRDRGCGCHGGKDLRGTGATAGLESPGQGRAVQGRAGKENVFLAA